MATLRIGSATYDAKVFAKQLGSCPKVTIALSDINDSSDPSYTVEVSGNDAPAINDVVFFKQNGKFTVVLGQQHIEKNTVANAEGKAVRGLLVSSVVAKKALIHRVEVVKEPNKYGREEKPSGYQGSGYQQQSSHYHR